MAARARRVELPFRTEGCFGSSLDAARLGATEMFSTVNSEVRADGIDGLDFGIAFRINAQLDCM